MDITVRSISKKYAEVKIESEHAEFESGTLDKKQMEELALVFSAAADDLEYYAEVSTD
ncbi:MAG: hypothetical protein ABXS91_11205 [Sulfurimonas sp.]